jgi:cation transport regulator ChaB
MKPKTTNPYKENQDIPAIMRRMSPSKTQDMWKLHRNQSTNPLDLP